MRLNLSLAFALGAMAAIFRSTNAGAAFVIQIDTDGRDDGILAFHPNFSFGTGTTSASQSSPSSAVGLAPADSIFGGNATTELDTYAFRYTPSTTAGDVDNLSLTAGTPLNADGSVASGLPAGASGLYALYATWPTSTNVTGGPTTFRLPHDGGLLNVQIDQNNKGNAWIFLGNVQLTEGNRYDLNQIAGSNAFVSMRSSGVLFDRIPEPSATLLLGTAIAATVGFRRRR